MELGAKSIEILIQLLKKSEIATYFNMRRFLRVYEYPQHITSLFSGTQYYPEGMMPPDVDEEWGAVAIRIDLGGKDLLKDSGFFTKLTTDVLNEIEDNVLDIEYTRFISQRDIQRLLRHLELDGFKYENRALVPIEHDSEESQETKSLMESMISGSPELSGTVLSQHLRDCEDNYQVEHWKDSVAQARNFVEQLLEDVANAAAQAKKENPDLSKPVRVRDYLTKAGFFDEEERAKLVDGVYGYLSEEGSHPGISDDKVARVSRSIIISFGYYILEKFESWKKTGFATLPSIKGEPSVLVMEIKDFFQIVFGDFFYPQNVRRNACIKMRSEDAITS